MQEMVDGGSDPNDGDGNDGGGGGGGDDDDDDDDNDDDILTELYDYHDLFANTATDTTTITTTNAGCKSRMFVGHIVEDKINRKLEKEDYAFFKNINTLTRIDIKNKTNRIMDRMRHSRTALDSVAQELCSFRSFVASDGKLIIGNTDSWRRGIKLLVNILRSDSPIYQRLVPLEETSANCSGTNIRHMLDLNNGDGNSNIGKTTESCGVLYAMHVFSAYNERCKKITRSTINANTALQKLHKSHNRSIMSLDVNPRKGVDEFIVDLLFDPLSTVGLTKLSLSNTKAVKLNHNTIELLLNDISRVPLDSGKKLLQLLQNRMRTNEQALSVSHNDNDRTNRNNNSNNNNNNSDNTDNINTNNENAGIRQKSFHNKKGTHVGKVEYFNNAITPLVRQIQNYTCAATTAGITRDDECDTSVSNYNKKKLLSGQFSCNMIKRVVSTMATVHTRDLFESSKEVIATIALFFMSNSYTFQFGLDTAMLKRILFIPCETVLESSNKNIHVSNLVKLIKTGLKTIHSGLVKRRLQKWNNNGGGGGGSGNSSGGNSNSSGDIVYEADDWKYALCNALHTDIDNVKKTIFDPKEVPCRITQHILQYGVYEISDRQKNAGVTMAGNTFFTLYYNILLGSFLPNINNNMVNNNNNDNINNNGSNNNNNITMKQRHHRHFCCINPKDLKTFSTAIEAARCGSTRRLEKVFKPLLFILAPFEPSGDNDGGGDGDDDEEDIEGNKRGVLSLSVDGPKITVVREDGSVDSMLCNVYVPNVDRHVFLYTALPASVSVGSIIYKHLNTVWGSSDVTNLQYSCHHLHICFELIYRADNPAARLANLIENNREEMIEFMIACTVYKNILETMGVMDCFFTKYEDDDDDDDDNDVFDDEDKNNENNNQHHHHHRHQVLSPHGNMSNTLVFPIIVVNYDLSTLLTMANLTMKNAESNYSFHCQLVRRVTNNMGLELNPKYLCSRCRRRE